MAGRNAHPSDQDLLLALDNELAPRRFARLGHHIASCEVCCKRLSAFEDSIREVADFYRKEFGDDETPGPIALLRARLSDTAKPTVFNHQLVDRVPLRHARLAMACCIILILLAGAWTMKRLGVDLGNSGFIAPAVEPDAVPKPDLTPGAALPLLVGDVCDSTAQRHSVPHVPRALRIQVFEAYGIKDPVPGAYEVDYLITPGLGGAAELKDLWPEPYFNIEWNARVKDALEERLKTMVCRGDVHLKTAQRDIATDWIAAYKKYVHSGEPLPNPTSVAANEDYPLLAALFLRARTSF